MLKNYLKIAVRNLRRQKGYTFINLTGLAVGWGLRIRLKRLEHHADRVAAVLAESGSRQRPARSCRKTRSTPMWGSTDRRDMTAVWSSRIRSVPGRPPARRRRRRTKGR